VDLNQVGIIDARFITAQSIPDMVLLTTCKTIVVEMVRHLPP
jgi:hypothetical protein